MLSKVKKTLVLEKSGCRNNPAKLNLVHNTRIKPKTWEEKNYLRQDGPPVLWARILLSNLPITRSLTV